MRDMSQVLERWAGWASTENAGVDYSPIAAGFKGLIVQSSRIRMSCNDDDGLLIDSCVAKLRKKRPDEYNVMVLFYLYGVSKRKIAKQLKCDEKLVRIKIQMAEGFVDGCLSWIDAKLEIE